MRKVFTANNILFLLIPLLLPLNAYAVTFPSLSEMLDNINDQLPYLWELVTAFAYLTGFFFVFKGVHHLKQYGDPQSQMSGGKNLSPALLSIIVGAALIYVPTAMQTSLVSIFGTSSAMAYPTGSGVDASFTELGQIIVAIIQFMGAVAFIRGLMQFHRLGGGQAQPGTFGKGLTHIIGGTLALNVVGTANVLASTLGIAWN